MNNIDNYSHAIADLKLFSHAYHKSQNQLEIDFHDVERARIEQFVADRFPHFHHTIDNHPLFGTFVVRINLTVEDSPRNALSILVHANDITVERRGEFEEEHLNAVDAALRHSNSLKTEYLTPGQENILRNNTKDYLESIRLKSPSIETAKEWIKLVGAYSENFETSEAVRDALARQVVIDAENQDELLDDLIYIARFYTGTTGLENTFAQFSTERTLPSLDTQKRFIQNFIDPVGHLRSFSPEIQEKVYPHIRTIAKENDVHIGEWDQEYGRYHAEDDHVRLREAIKRTMLPVRDLHTLRAEQKETVYQYVRSLAKHSGVVIENWDQEYGKYHAEEDLDRLALALDVFNDFGSTALEVFNH